MDGKTIGSMFIIAIAVFIFITIIKLEDFPQGDCCKDIKNAESTVCIKCQDYELFEKVIYVWKYS